MIPDYRVPDENPQNVNNVETNIIVDADPMHGEINLEMIEMDEIDLKLKD